MKVLNLKILKDQQSPSGNISFESLKTIRLQKNGTGIIHNVTTILDRRPAVEGEALRPVTK